MIRGKCASASSTACRLATRVTPRLSAWRQSTRRVWSASTGSMAETGSSASSRLGSLHRGWIEGLLGEYYDPMYVYQRESKAERVEFAGDAGAIRAYLAERSRR